MNAPNESQEKFLNQAIKDRTTVNVFLMSGVRLNGRIVGSDEHTLTLTTSNDQENQLVYKHAVATIVPRGNG